MIRMLAILFLLTGSRTAFAQCSDADKKSLEAFDKAWGDASVGGDRAFLQNAYADDFAGLGVGGATTKALTVANTVSDAERNRANPQNANRIPPDNYIIVCTPNTATITHGNTFISSATPRKRPSTAAASTFWKSGEGAGRLSAAPATHSTIRPRCSI